MKIINDRSRTFLQKSIVVSYLISKDFVTKSNFNEEGDFEGKVQIEHRCTLFENY